MFNTSFDVTIIMPAEKQGACTDSEARTKMFRQNYDKDIPEGRKVQKSDLRKGREEWEERMNTCATCIFFVMRGCSLFNLLVSDHGHCSKYSPSPDFFVLPEDMEHRKYRR